MLNTDTPEKARAKRLQAKYETLSGWLQLFLLICKTSCVYYMKISRSETAH